jgi:hypothetical protein
MTAQSKQKETPDVKSTLVAKDERNGIVRPKPGTKTGRVWVLADELSKEAGAPAQRKDVIGCTTAEEINIATASTQYGRWRKYYGLGAEKDPETEVKAPESKTSKAKKGKEVPSDVEVQSAT